MSDTTDVDDNTTPEMEVATPAGYEAPGVEQVLTNEALARAVHYAGDPVSVDMSDT